MKKYKFVIEGMDCDGCVRVVKKTIESLGGRNVEVSLEDCSALFEGQEMNLDDIKDAITKRGYKIVQVSEEN
jgi:copper chaperone CopZ